MPRKTSLIILLIVSFAIHFAFFGHPNETVFDEVHFGKFVSAYYTGQYYFDIHPPGGKLIIAGFAKLFNFSPEYSFAQIGQPFPDHKYLALRFLPALAGAMLPIIIYLLALELGLSGWAAFGAGMLTALDNALLTQSRYILLDPFLLSFGFATLLFYFRWRRSSHPRDLAAMAIFGGLAFSIKWTGLTFLGIAGLMELIEIIRNFSSRRIRDLIVYFGALPFAIYFSIFTIHFALLPKSGEGDAFMTPSFQKTLQGSVYENDSSIQSSGLLSKFTELNLEMYNANATLTATHPYGSKWYTWPFMIRPIYYWNHASTDSPTEEKIYLIGNPIVWWLSTIAILYLILSAFSQNIFKHRTPLLLIGGFFVNLLPFIGISRVMFLYHYLSALIFTILALGYLLDSMGKKRAVVWIIIAAAGLSFIYFSPLSYGLPLEAHSFQNRLWLPTWQ